MKAGNGSASDSTQSSQYCSLVCWAARGGRDFSVSIFQTPKGYRSRLRTSYLVRGNPSKAVSASYCVGWRTIPRGTTRDSLRRPSRASRALTLTRSARIVAGSGAADAWREAMRKDAHSVLVDWDADLAVVGLVKQHGEALSLWFVPRLGEGTLSRGDHTYELARATLGRDFHDDFRTELTAVALVAIAPLAETETGGRVLEQGPEGRHRKARRPTREPRRDRA